MNVKEDMDKDVDKDVDEDAGRTRIGTDEDVDDM